MYVSFEFSSIFLSVAFVRPHLIADMSNVLVCVCVLEITMRHLSELFISGRYTTAACSVKGTENFAMFLCIILSIHSTNSTNC